MALQKSRKGFLDTEEGQEIKSNLQLMVGSASYNTEAGYSTNAVLYPDNLIPFVDKHINYLINNPRLEPRKYLANIKLITRVR
jgi:hypothetical protein